jgi:hypothetical protein
MKDIAMTNKLLEIKATCKGNDKCLFDGQDIFLDINITNKQNTEIGFPLDFRQKTGPYIKLIDTRTKAESDLRTNLASEKLLEKFTLIKPGESIALRWVIHNDELQQFNGPYVDLSAVIKVAADIQVNEKIVHFDGIDTIRIVSKDKP